jgi:hypothetical protein
MTKMQDQNENLVENEQTEQLTEHQVRMLINDLRREAANVESIRAMASFRVRTYEDRTTRVKFLRKPEKKVLRDLRRLQEAKALANRCIEALSGLASQVNFYERQLASTVG